MNTQALRAIWLAAGGTFHGPLVEHGSINEEALYPLLKEVALARAYNEAVERSADINQCDDAYLAWTKVEELRKEIYEANSNAGQ
jgi:hypothetical protein